MPYRTCANIVLALLTILTSTQIVARAQEYPSRLIRVVVGPGPDLVARLFGSKMTEALLGRRLWSSHGREQVAS